MHHHIYVDLSSLNSYRFKLSKLVNFLTKFFYFTSFFFWQTSLSYYDLKDALTLDPEQPEAQKILQDLEKRAQDNRDFAVRLQLQGKFKEAMQKITLAIEMNPSVAEFHLLR